jgi:hypothetical protein
MVDLALSLTIIRRHVGSSPGLGACMYLSKLSKSVPLDAVFAQSTFVRQGCSWRDELGCL